MVGHGCHRQRHAAARQHVALEAIVVSIQQCAAPLVPRQPAVNTASGTLRCSYSSSLTTALKEPSKRVPLLLEFAENIKGGGGRVRVSFDDRRQREQRAAPYVAYVSQHTSAYVSMCAIRRIPRQHTSAYLNAC